MFRHSTVGFIISKFCRNSFSLRSTLMPKSLISCIEISSSLAKSSKSSNVNELDPTELIDFTLASYSWQPIRTIFIIWIIWTNLLVRKMYSLDLWGHINLPNRLLYYDLVLSFSSLFNKSIMPSIFLAL